MGMGFDHYFNFARHFTMACYLTTGLRRSKIYLCSSAYICGKKAFFLCLELFRSALALH